jgi:hypothetical protein
MNAPRLSLLLVVMTVSSGPACSNGSSSRPGLLPQGGNDGSVADASHGADVATGPDGTHPGLDGPVADGAAVDTASIDAPPTPPGDGATDLPPEPSEPTTAEWAWENPLPQGSALHDVWTNGPNDVWAVGACGTRIHWNGASFSVETAARADVWSGLWGSSPTDLWSVGVHGRIAHFDGHTWTSVASPTETDLMDVRGSGPRDVWAVGADGTFLQADGTTWKPSG